MLPVVSLGLDQKIIENTVVKEKSTTVFWEKAKEHKCQKKRKKKRRENWEFCQCYLGGKWKCGSGQDTMRWQFSGNMMVCLGLAFLVKSLSLPEWGELLPAPSLRLWIGPFQRKCSAWAAARSETLQGGEDLGLSSAVNGMKHPRQ